jgi:hypothetical protein
MRIDQLKFDYIIPAIIIAVSLVFTAVYEKPTTKSELIAAKYLASRFGTVKDSNAAIFAIYESGVATPRIRNLAAEEIFKR